MNQQSEQPENYQGCDSKVNLGRGFTVNHFWLAGSLPSLALIMAHTNCSKTLASRAYNLAKADLGLK